MRDGRGFCGRPCRDPGRWRALLSGGACEICRTTRPAEVVIAEMEASYLTTERGTPFRGYCCPVLKRHAVELHDLKNEEADQRLKEWGIARSPEGLFAGDAPQRGPLRRALGRGRDRAVLPLDDAYRSLGPGGGKRYGFLKKLSDSEVLALVLFQQLRGAVCSIVLRGGSRNCGHEILATLV